MQEKIKEIKNIAEQISEIAKSKRYDGRISDIRDFAEALQIKVDMLDDKRTWWKFWVKG